MKEFTFTFRKTTFTPLIAGALLISILPGCGKKEAAGGAIGAASGGLIGHVVTGGKHNAAGTLIGGLIGGLVGSSIGRASDEEDAEEEKEVKDTQIALLKNENRKLRSNLTTWCADCGRTCNIVGAHSCASCGGMLIREKFCKTCSTIFSPCTGYRYCPYCKDRVLLCGR